MSTLTTNFKFVLPSINNPIDANIWGGQINGDFTSLDTFLDSIITNNIAITAPTIPATAAPTAGMFWINNTTGVGGVWPLQVYDGTAWTLIGSIDSSMHIFIPASPFSTNVQIFSTAGTFTYTPSPGMSSCIVECVGGGGGSGSVPANTTIAASGGGGGGGYSKQIFTAAQIGASQTIVVGAAGLGGATGVPANTPAGTGGNSTFGAFLVSNGGVGGMSSDVTIISAPFDVYLSGGGLGGTATGGYININGSSGGDGIFQGSALAGPGAAGSSSLGGSIRAGSYSHGFTPSGATVTAPGVGGNGVFSRVGATPGNNGVAGIIIITEYV